MSQPTTLLNHRKLGRVTVDDHFLRLSIQAGAAAELFNGSVPLDVTRDWFQRTSTFLLWHPQFDDCPDGSIVPHYQARISKNADGSHNIEWTLAGYNDNGPLITSEFFNQLLGAAA